MNRKVVFNYETLYMAAFTIYIFYCLINATMFYVYLPSLGRYFEYGSMLLFAFNLFAQRRVSAFNLALQAVIVMTMLLIAHYTEYDTVVTVFCFILAARSVRFEKIVRTFVAASMTVILVTLLSVRLGIIENVSWQSTLGSTGKRYAMGYIYPTDFVSCVFYTVCGLIYIQRDEKFSIVRFAFYLAVAYLTFVGCRTRLDSSSIALLAFVYMYVTLRDRRKPIGRFSRIVYMLAVPVCAVVSILVTDRYSYGNSFLFALDVLLSGRLSLGKRGIEKYGFTLFGQDIFMKGNSVKSAKVFGDYFYIDCSYLNIGLRYGMVCLVLVCGLLIYLIYKRLKEGDYVIPLILMFIAINSMISHHIFDGFSNVFVFATFADMRTAPGKRRHRLFRLHSLRKRTIATYR